MKLSVYDTGNGLAICQGIDEVEVPFMFLKDHIVARIRAPDNNLPMDVWEKQFEKQKELLNKMADAYNEIYGE